MIKEIGPDPFGEFNNKIATGEVTLPPAQEIPKEVLEQNNTQQTATQSFDMYNQQANTAQPMQQTNTAQPAQPNVYNQQMDMSNPQINMAQPIQPNPYNQMNMANMTQPAQTNTIPPMQPNPYNQMNMTNMAQPVHQDVYNQQMNMNQPVQQTMYPPQDNMVPPMQPNPYSQMNMANMAQPVQTQPSFNIPVVDNTVPIIDTTPVVDNTAPVIDNTAPVVDNTPVVNNATPVADNTPISTPISTPALTKLNITPANVPDKKLTDCNLDELLAAVSDIVSENCYQYINKVLGNDIEIATLSDTPSKAECANLLNSIPLTINSVEKWIAVETELEKNAELYKKASDWVTSTIRENSGNPKFAMGRSDVVIGLYRKYYNSTEDLSQNKKAKSNKAESDPKESDVDESGSEQPKPKRTRSSKKKNNTVTDTRATVPLIEQPNQTPVEQAAKNTIPQQMTQPANFSMPTPMEQTVTQTTPVTSTTANDTSTMPFEW